jgi:hypothetical protein
LPAMSFWVTVRRGVPRPAGPRPAPRRPGPASRLRLTVTIQLSLTARRQSGRTAGALSRGFPRDAAHPSRGGPSGRSGPSSRFGFLERSALLPSGAGRPPPLRAESPLPLLPRPAHAPRGLGRALRGGRQPRLRLPEVPRHREEGRAEPREGLVRLLPRAPGQLRDPDEHARPGAGSLPRPLGPERRARLRSGRREVRPLAVGRSVPRSAAGLRGRSGPPRHRGRAHLLLHVLPPRGPRGLGGEPDERPEQRQRDRRRVRLSRLRPRQPVAHPGPEGARPQAHRGAPRRRQPVLRDRERGVPLVRAGAAGLAGRDAPHRRRRAAGDGQPGAPRREPGPGEEAREPALSGHVDPELPLRLAALRRRGQPAPRPADRLRRGRLRRARELDLPRERVGVPDGGRGGLRQPGLLVRRGPRGRKGGAGESTGVGRPPPCAGSCAS